jgi:thiol-disulfide isomerase/thioredoxin
MTVCLALVTLTIASLITSDAIAVDKGWTVSFAEAKAQAAKEGKSILIDFTGSDWCGPCIALHKSVFMSEHFKAEAPKHFILLSLDRPNDKSKQSLEEQAQFRKLSAIFNINSFPTIFLADEKGRPYHRDVTGGGSKDPMKYLASLTQNTASLAARNEILAKADQAEGVERAKLLNQAITNLSKNNIETDVVINTYADTVKDIISLDADGKAGLKAKYESALQVGEIKTALTEIQGGLRNGTPDEAIAKIDKLLAEKKPTGEALQEVLYLKSLVKFRSGDKETAQKLLEEAKAVAPESKRAANIDEVLKNVFKVGK